jgi:dimethylamine monooxygenase subunit A
MPSAAPYRPYLAGPFRWRLGLRPLDLADWFEFGDDADELLAAKADVLAHHHDTAVAHLDGIEPEAAEVFEAIVDHLARWFPERDGAVAALPSSLHPLDAAGRLVPEDLALLVERDGRLVFGGGSICFPNRWDLRSKVGRSLAEVHAPVARLNDQLAEPIDRFFERLTPERSFWRLGWGVIDTAELYQPLDGTAPPGPADPAPSDLFLRVERETLRRFPATGCVLFTIRTHLTPLPAVRHEPGEAARLADAVEAFPHDVAEYKQLDELGPAVVAWLRDGVATSGT